MHPDGEALDPRLLRQAQRLGIDRLVVSSLGAWDYEPSHEECERANRDVRRLMQEHPGLVLGLAYVNPCHPRAVAEFERCVVEWGFAGLKLWVACRITDERARPVLAKAGELRVPVLAHAWHKITGNLPHESYPEEVARAACGFPEVQFIMAHIGGDWVRGLRAVRHQPNVAVDTAGSIVDCGMIEQAVAELGARRVVFGSDAHGADLAVNLAKVTGARIPVRARRLILGGNFARLARLKKGLSPNGGCPLPGEKWSTGLTWLCHPVGLATPSQRDLWPQEERDSPRPVIDVNAYLGEWPFRAVRRLPALRRLLAGAGITRALVSPLAAIFRQECQSANAELARAVRGHGEFFIPLPALNPAYPGWEGDLEAAVEQGAVRRLRAPGVRLFPNYHAYSLADTAARVAVAQAAAAGLAIFVSLRMQDERHHHPRMMAPAVPAAEVAALARAVPEARIVACMARYGEAETLLAAENVWLDLSGVQGPVGCIDLLAERFGAGRLLLGTGAALQYPLPAVAKVLASEIASDDRDRVLGLNAASLLTPAGVHLHPRLVTKKR